jgi:hypothetical protein
MREQAPAPPLGGRFVVDLTKDSWWWSDGLYRLLGYQADGVTPGADRLLAHTDRAARAWWADAFARWRGGEVAVLGTVAMQDRQGRSFEAVVAGGVQDAPVGATGVVVDGWVLRTPDLGADALVVEERIAAEVRTRETIDEAKGIVAAALGTDPGTGFDLLREAATRRAVPVRVLAQHIVRKAPSVEVASLEEWLRDLMEMAARGDAGQRHPDAADEPAGRPQ